MQSIKKIKPGVFERFGIISEMLARRSVRIPLSFAAAAEWEAMGCRVGHMLKVKLAASPITMLKTVSPGKRVRLKPDSSAFVGLSPSNQIDFCDRIPILEASNGKQCQY